LYGIHGSKIEFDIYIISVFSENSGDIDEDRKVIILGAGK